MNLLLQASKAKEAVQQVLLNVGMDVYRYVEGDSSEDEAPAGPRRTAKKLV